jgi:Antitoxin-like ribbon-helix-helix
MTNKFASALKRQAAAGGGGNQAAGQEEPAGRGKHIGGYFDPAVSKQLRTLMVDEDTTIQALLEEALDLLFQTRNRPMIARKNT